MKKHLSAGASLAAVALLFGGCDAAGLGDRVFEEHGNRQIVENRDAFGGRMFYYVDKASGTRSDLLGVCATDCNEKIESTQWSPEGKAFGFLISGSNRYAKGTRFVIFDLASSQPKNALDVTQEPVYSFTLSDSTVSYAVQGTTKTARYR